MPGTKEALKQTVTPYLCVKDASKALEFYARAFRAKEIYRLAEPGTGKIGHAEFEIGNSRLMISDEYPDFGALSPQTVGGSPIKIHLRVDNVDSFVKHAVAAGATMLRPPKDQFFGERNSMIADPFGHGWFVTTQVEDVSPVEMQRRWAKAFETQ
jgi:PhnB protein